MIYSLFLRQVARMIIMVALSFFVCWTPLFITNIVSQSQGFRQQSHFLFTMLLTHLLGFINSATNPLIYHFMSERFRASFTTIVCAVLCCGKRAVASRSSLSSDNDNRRHNDHVIRSGCNRLTQEYQLSSSVRSRNSVKTERSQPQRHSGRHCGNKSSDSNVIVDVKPTGTSIRYSNDRDYTQHQGRVYVSGHETRCAMMTSPKTQVANHSHAKSLDLKVSIQSGNAATRTVVQSTDNIPLLDNPEMSPISAPAHLSRVDNVITEVDFSSAILGNYKQDTPRVEKSGIFTSHSMPYLPDFGNGNELQRQHVHSLSDNDISTNKHSHSSAPNNR